MEAPGHSAGDIEGKDQIAIDDSARAEIRRLYRAEHWAVGTIARQLDLHHTTVARALRIDDPKAELAVRPHMIDRYLPFIKDTLKKHPEIPASSLHKMVVDRGYRGGPDHFRHLVSTLRPKRKRKSKAYLRIEILAGEEAQVDWADFGAITIGRATRKLMGFVMVLGYSRSLFVQFSYSVSMCHFLHGHVAAFEAFGGVARQNLYDNLKSVVTDRRGRAINYNATFLQFAGHYCFEPQVAWPRQPQEKGRVERSIAYIRSAFMAGRDITTPLDELNAAAREWCAGPASERPWPEDRTLRVGDAFAKEQPLLIARPETEFPVEQIKSARADKTAFIRFDLNDCSVPPGHAGKALTVAVTPDQVRILDVGTVVAVHQRNYGRQARIEDPEHIRALVEQKRSARRQISRNKLSRAVPRSKELLTLAVSRGDNVAMTETALLRLLDSYGADELDAAIAGAIERDSAHPNTVRCILEQRRAARKQPPALPSPHGDDPRLAAQTPHRRNLEAYDGLAKTETRT